MLSKDVKKGQAVYTKLGLAIYNFWVLGVSNQYIWSCPSPQLIAHFNKHITPNHLDIGVGTGYFLDKCKFNIADADVRIALMDLNQNSLDKAYNILKRYSPSRYRYNVLEKIDLETNSFDSISMNYLFHCLPGQLSDKLKVLDNIDHLLAQGGTIFGATLLSKGVKKNAAANRLMAIYNSKGIFSNTEDSLEDLESYLANKYSNYEIEVQGCVALFSANK